MSFFVFFALGFGIAHACVAPQPLPYPPGQVTILTVQRPEGLRKYHVYVPSTYDYKTARPLHLCFHGLNDNCGHMMTASGLKEYAEKNNFVFVTPCASFGDLGWAWNSGRCCGFTAESKVDDFVFTDDIIAKLKSTMCVDTKKIYASGFSNGAMMAEVLACNRSNVFRAVASISGVVELRPGNKGGLAVCDTDYARDGGFVSELNVHGDYDPLVPWIGDEILGFPPMPEDFARWGKRNNCVGEPVTTFTNGPYSNQVYQNCSRGTQIELVKHHGGGHEWPVDKYFDTPDYIVKFFERVSGN